MAAVPYSIDSTKAAKHPLKNFTALASAIAGEIDTRDAILDGEIVCLNPKDGRSIFADLMYRRAEPYFYDLLWLNGKDLRHLPFLERKRRLKTDAGSTVTSLVCRPC